MLNLKEHTLTLFLTVTTGITIFIFTLTNSHVPIPVFDFDDILFEHQTSQGHIVVSTNPYNELILAFTGRNIGNMAYLGSTTTSIDSDFTHLMLPATADIPFTTHAVVSTNSNLHEILVIESGTSIAHHAQGKEATDPDTTVFMVASTDLTGSEALIIGLTSNHEIILEIEIP